MKGEFFLSAARRSCIYKTKCEKSSRMTQKHCPRIKHLIASRDFKEGFLSIARMRCRQWDCEYCSTKNADMWRAHLLETFCNRLSEKRWVFITLTVPSWAHKKDPDVSLKILKQAWGGLYDRLRYKNGGSLSYVMVYETHESGVFHVHALVDMGDIYDGYGVIIDEALSGEARIEAEKKHPFCLWLMEKCVDVKLGWVCHATRIREGKTGKDNARLAVGYMTKYFTKGVRDIVLPKRWRRVGTSRDIGSPRSKSSKKYSWMLRAPVHHSQARHEAIWLVNEGRVLSAGDFGDDGYYPNLD
jgi:hypothetical protein